VINAISARRPLYYILQNIEQALSGHTNLDVNIGGFYDGDGIAGFGWPWAR
jgi:hypothetical protein